MKTSTFATIGALALATGLVPALAVSPASAAVVSISSSSTAFMLALEIQGLGDINLGPLVSAAGSAPPAYNVTNSVASINLPSLGLTTGLVTDKASSPFPPTPTGTASSTIANFSFAPLLGALFNLTATSISSTSSVDGAPSATGSTTIDDMSLTIPGQTPIMFSGTPSVNDVIFNMGGLSVVLNQQIADPSESAGITTNAIAIDFTNLPIGPNVVNGSIDIGQSKASIILGIPEPATWAEMLAGFVGLGFLMAFRTRAKGEAPA
jgi:hypothetical protein